MRHLIRLLRRAAPDANTARSTAPIAYLEALVFRLVYHSGFAATAATEGQDDGTDGAWREGAQVVSQYLSSARSYYERHSPLGSISVEARAGSAAASLLDPWLVDDAGASLQRLLSSLTASLDQVQRS